MRVLSLFFLSSALLGLGAASHAQELDVTEIVSAHDAFTQAADKQTRTALAEALDRYQGDPTVESVNAHLALVLSDTAAAKYGDMRDSALAASNHLEPVADILPRQYAETKYVAAVALFNHRQKSEAMSEMAHVEGFCRQQIGNAEESPEWADDLKWKADAWGMAMDAYFEAEREKHPSDNELDAILKSYNIDEDALSAKAMLSEDEAGLPHCSGRMIQRPKMRYPSGKALRGKFGAVILGLEFDDEGQVINPKVLASVPIEEFDEKSLRVVGQWRFKPDDPDQVGISCRLERTDVVQPLVFQIR
ncbi:MAG: TonB family protein [Henriciella sp.]